MNISISFCSFSDLKNERQRQRTYLRNSRGQSKSLDDLRGPKSICRVVVHLDSTFIRHSYVLSKESSLDGFT